MDLEKHFRRVLKPIEHDPLEAVESRSKQQERELLNKKNEVEKLRDQVAELEVDPVTRLLKHNFLEHKLADLISILNSGGQYENKPLLGVVIMTLDLDDLKSLNSLGRHVGNKALKAIADALRGSTKAKDYICRLGDQSDEVVVVMPIDETLDDDLIRENIFNRVRDRVNSQFIEVDGQKIPITAAAGFLILRPGESRNVKEILIDVDAQQLSEKKSEVKKARKEKAAKALS